MLEQLKEANGPFTNAEDVEAYINSDDPEKLKQQDEDGDQVREGEQHDSTTGRSSVPDPSQQAAGRQTEGEDSAGVRRGADNLPRKEGRPDLQRLRRLQSQPEGDSGGRVGHVIGVVYDLPGADRAASEYITMLSKV